jgi:hypothetical protein
MTMISTDFNRLPTTLQCHIFKLATYNPFRKSELIERWTVPYGGIVELRITPKSANGRYYVIRASWETDSLHHIYIHRFIGDETYMEPVLIYRPKADVRPLEIIDRTVSEAIYELINVYRDRKMETGTIVHRPPSQVE